MENASCGGRRLEEQAFPGLKFHLKYAVLGGIRVFRQQASCRKRVLQRKYIMRIGNAHLKFLVAKKLL